MKTIAQPAVITPTIIGLAILFAAITFIGVTGKKIPVLSNVRADIILLVLIGMAFAGWKLSFIANDQQALLAIAILAGLKVVNAVTHYLLART